jgi:7-keto-8-aminopelargonate synthetase-like enzyme
MIGDDRLAMIVSQRLLEAGVFAPAIRPPTVPKGTSRIRTTIMASHTREDIDHVLESLDQIACSLRFR